MKKRPSTQLNNVYNNPKDLMKRLKSPQSKKSFTKKNQEGSSIILSKPKLSKKAEETKGDSNNTTTSMKSKQIKLAKKSRSKSTQDMNEHEIMAIINSFASKIQKQWRAYIFRKRLEIVLSIKRQERKKQNKKGNIVFDLNKNSRKMKQVHYLEEQVISSGTTLYDNQKYGVLSSFKESSIYEKSKGQSSARSKSSKNINSSRSSNLTPRNRVQKVSSHSKTPKQISTHIKEQLSRSLERQTSSQASQKEKQARRASFNVLEQRKALENRRHSTGELPPPLRSVSEKQLQIGKAYDIIIEQPGSKNRQRAGNDSPSKAKKIESEGTIAFKRGSYIEKIGSSCKKQIELTKLKQLLSVQNRYNKNEVTYRSYLQIVGKINEEHTSKLQEIRKRQGYLKNALGQLIQIYKSNPHQKRFHQDDPHSVSHLDVSLSFDKWDFNSSAKKSIEHFDVPQGNNSKVLSIESVLRELQEEETGLVNEDRKFKKNKSLQMIETIAQRSKQISDKDIGSFEETPPCPTQLIAIQQPEENKEKEEKAYELIKAVLSPRSGILQNTPQVQKSQYSIQCKEDQMVQKAEQKVQPPQSASNKFIDKIQQIPSSQSLVISPAKPTLFVPSEDSIQSNPQKQKLNQLIFKEIKTSPIDYDDPLVSKFRDLVIQKILMSNIKMINSFKFLFSKAGQERKKKKVVIDYPSFEAGINSVNSWLLQIAHFVLDSYSKVLRDNVLLVKQPAPHEVLDMARKGLGAMPIYESITQCMFKDFEFYYIRTLHRNQGLQMSQFDVFSGMVYTYHRCLIDGLNLALMEQLQTGRDWIITPWTMPIKVKGKRSFQDQVKSGLQRSINVVSNWGEYDLGKLVLDQEFSQAEYRQFQDQKIKLVCREEVLQMKLNPTFFVGQVLLQLGEQLYQDQLRLALQDLSFVLK